MTLSQQVSKWTFFQCLPTIEPADAWDEAYLPDPILSQRDPDARRLVEDGGGPEPELTLEQIINIVVMEAKIEIYKKTLAALVGREDVPGVTRHQERLFEQLRELEFRGACSN